jgi:acyl carrier protein
MKGAKMTIRERVTEVIEREIADAFMLEREYVAANHGLKLREDLVATSFHYFTLVSALEEELDMPVDFHDFQYESGTIALAIDYAVKLYNEQQQSNN